MNIKIITKTSVVALAIAVLPVLSAIQAGAAAITGRSITLSSSAGAATGVTYTLATAALPTTTAVKSMEVKFCDSLAESCSTPTGFSALSSTLAEQPDGLGSATGWTVSAATAGSLRIVNAANTTASSGAVEVVWGGVANPTAANTAYYGIITTYSDDSWATAIDTGTVALSTSTQVQVTLMVDETLTFCTGTSITGENCGTIAGSVVDLGVGSTTSTVSGTSVMAASTNGNSGYSIAVKGSTLTSGSNTITALTTGGTSSVGTRQFGLNLAAANTTPEVGAAKTGTGSGTATANYNINNTFRFTDGEIVASASGLTNANAFTVGYIANIDGTTPAGVYATVLTYVATANF